MALKAVKEIKYKPIKIVSLFDEELQGGWGFLAEKLCEVPRNI